MRNTTVFFDMYSRRLRLTAGLTRFFCFCGGKRQRLRLHETQIVQSRNGAIRLSNQLLGIADAILVFLFVNCYVFRDMF